MPNPKGNPETLKSFKPKWRSGKTRTIRVPIAITDKVLEAARLIDQGKSLSSDTSGIDDNYSLTITGDKTELIASIEKASAISSNRGGQIKKAFAASFELLGINLEKTSKGWKVNDTSESTS